MCAPNKFVEITVVYKLGVDTSIKLWSNLTTPDICTQIQTIELLPISEDSREFFE